MKGFLATEQVLVAKDNRLHKDGMHILKMQVIVFGWKTSMQEEKLYC